MPDLCDMVCHCHTVTAVPHMDSTVTDAYCMTRCLGFVLSLDSNVSCNTLPYILGPVCCVLDGYVPEGRKRGKCSSVQCTVLLVQRITKKKKTIILVPVVEWTGTLNVLLLVQYNKK